MRTAGPYVARPPTTVHLEDPPGSGLAACDGKPLPIVPQNYAGPFEFCIGCGLAARDQSPPDPEVPS